MSYIYDIYYIIFKCYIHTYIDLTYIYVYKLVPHPPTFKTGLTPLVPALSIIDDNIKCYYFTPWNFLSDSCADTF